MLARHERAEGKHMRTILVGILVVLIIGFARCGRCAGLQCVYRSVGEFRFGRIICNRCCYKTRRDCTDGRNTAGRRWYFSRPTHLNQRRIRRSRPPPLADRYTNRADTHRFHRQIHRHRWLCRQPIHRCRRQIRRCLLPANQRQRHQRNLLESSGSFPEFTPGGLIWFEWTIVNSSGNPVPYGCIGAMPQKDGADRPDWFKTSWGGSPETLCHHKGLAPMTISYSTKPAITLRLAISFDDYSVCSNEAAHTIRFPTRFHLPYGNG